MIDKYDNSPPFVRFETRAVEDGPASREKGYYVCKDVDFIIIVPRGSAGKVQIEQPYERWLKTVRDTPFREEIRAGDADTPMSAARFPDAWVEQIEKAYAAWKSGQVLPESGTPLAQWGVCSPAQREGLAALHIYTVEQLAAATEEALTNFGMGGRALRDRARTFLETREGRENKIAAEMAALREKNERLEAHLKILTEKLEKLNATNAASDSPSVRG